MIFEKPLPLLEAIRKLGDRNPIASLLRSAEWADVPLALRERAQFSAGVENARVLDRFQESLSHAISLVQEELAGGKSAFVDRSSFIGDLRRLVLEQGLGAAPESAEAGTVQDLSSRARLGLIYDMQVKSAQGFARFKAGADPDLLDAFPAQEFLRVESRREERTDWPDRWIAAGGRFFGTRMIALKDDPVWRNLSRFGTPWPPFDFGSGMGVEDVSRDEAEALGLLARDERIESPALAFNEDLSASVADLSPAAQAYLRDAFGDQIQLAGGTARWRGDSAA